MSLSALNSISPAKETPFKKPVKIFEKLLSCFSRLHHPLKSKNGFIKRYT